MRAQRELRHYAVAPASYGEVLRVQYREGEGETGLPGRRGVRAGLAFGKWNGGDGHVRQHNRGGGLSI
jgi:hypothetical protein